MDPALHQFEGAPSCLSSSSAVSALPPAATRNITGHASTLRFLHTIEGRKDVIVKHFTPSWFSVALGTSSVANSIGVCPMQFQGQVYVAWAFWFLAAALFLVFSCLMLGRIVFFTSSMPHLLRHPNQSLFFGAVPMCLTSLTSGVPLLFKHQFGKASVYAATALFYINLPAVLACIVLVPFTMFTAHDHTMTSMTAVWLLPVVPAIVAANSAGLLAQHLDVRHGGSLVFLGLVLLGVGAPLSFQVCTIFYNRLICHNLPAREVVVSSFLPVGATAMTAWSFMDLALAARTHAVAYTRTHHEFKGDVDEQMIHTAGNIFLAAAIVVSVLLWGYAMWWLLMGIASVLETFSQGIPFNLGWWGSVFPLGALTGATCRIAITTHAHGFWWIAVVLVCCHVLLWLVVASLTATRAWTGHLFHPPCLPQPDVNNSRQIPGALQGGSGDHHAPDRAHSVSQAASDVEERLQRVMAWSVTSLTHRGRGTPKRPSFTEGCQA